MESTKSNKIFDHLSQSSGISIQVTDFEFQIPGFNLIRLLGKGGMGVVFEGEEHKTSQKFAIKILNPKFTQNARINRLFENEAKIVAQLKHKNIVTVYDIRKTENLYYIIMELCKGQILSKRLKEGLLPIEQTLSLILSILSALNYAHEKGIVHHDIKPGNIMMTEEDRPVLCDFGLASIKTDEEELIKKKSYGTPQYLSPEKIKGQMTPEIEHLSDLFALGVVFYEMLTGKLPFTGPTKEILFENILHSPPASPLLVNPYIPLPLEAIISRLLDKNFQNRYQSAREVTTDLEAYQKKRPTSALKRSYLYRAYLALKRHPRRSLLFILLVGITFFFATLLIKEKNKTLFSWIPEESFSLQALLDSTNLWNCWDPRTLAPLSFSRIDDFFYLKKESIEFLETGNSILAYAPKIALPDFQLMTQVKDTSKNPDWGFYFGQQDYKNENHKGFFFFISSKGVEVHYPEITSPVYLSVTDDSLLNETTFSLEKQFPRLTVYSGKKPLLELDLLFVPLSPSWNSVGFFSKGSTQTLYSPKLSTKSQGYSLSPLEWPLSFLAKGELKSSEEEFEKLLKRTDDSQLTLYAHYFLAMTHLQNKNPEKALPLLEKTLSLTSENELRSKILLRLNWEKYIRGSIKSLREIVPPDPPLMVLLFLNELESSTTDYFKKNLESIIDQFLQLEGIDRNYFLAPVKTILENKIKTNLEEAQKFIDFHSVLFNTETPNNREADIKYRFKIADGYKNKKLYPKAISVYQSILNRYPDSSEVRFAANYGLQDCYFCLGDMEKANAYLEKNATEKN